MQFSLACGVTLTVAALSGIALWQDPVVPPPTLVTAAQRFLAALTDEQRAATSAELGDPSRLQWDFVPRQYPGIRLGALEPNQREAALALLRAVLSDRGLGKVEAIMALERVLHEIESDQGRDASHRDPDRYWLQVFGVPSRRGAFAFRLQGHHVSLHFAVADGRLCGATPAFLGANPHALPDGPRRGERVLAREEDLARALLALFDEVQLQRVVIAAAAPADVILGPQRGADGLGPPQGLPWSQLDGLQQQLLWRLIEEYVRLRHDTHAAAELDRIRAHGCDGIHFAWAGSLHRGQPHYYRVHGPTFVIEYDNTQDGANHVHTVYRDLQHDFGGDLLHRHLQEHHGRDRVRDR